MNNGRGMRTHKKTYVLLFLCLKKHTGTYVLLFLCLKKTHRNLCPFVLMSKKNYSRFFITQLNHTFSSVQSAISASSTSVLFT